METHAADLLQAVERMAAAAAQMEKAAAALESKHAEISGQVEKIVAAVEQEPGRREVELEQKRKAAEARIAELQAQAPGGRAASVRRTLPIAASQLLSKDGIAGVEQIEAGALDAALAGLSLEQRIAVKSQLMRAGKLV